jgi:hypothetical protein
MRSEMTQAIMDAINSSMANMSVALPGTIVSYDAGSGLVSVQPYGKIKKPDGTFIDYPIVTGIPIAQPSGIATPVVPGKACLLVMCDIDIAGWISGQTGKSSLRHSLSNAICIPGLQRTATQAQNLANSNNCVAISGNLVVSGSVQVAGSITSKGNCNAPNIK